MIYNTNPKVIKNRVARELRTHQFNDAMLDNVYASAYLQGWREAEAHYRHIQNKVCKITSDLENIKQ